MDKALFVWSYLPGAVAPVVSGRYQRNAGPPAAGAFVYGASFMRRPDRLSIDPVTLPLKEVEFQTVHLDGWFSALLDAGPDDWGRRLVTALHGAQETQSTLLLAQGHNAGNLAFSPSPDVPPPAPRRALRVKELDSLFRAHELIEKGAQLTEEARELLIPGSSAGGARPKTTVEHDGALWLAKFPSLSDPRDRPAVSHIEHVFLQLAQRCAIDAPASFVQETSGGPVLLVRRFDRVAAGGGFARVGYLSARTILWSRPEVQMYSYQGSYNNLVRQAARYCKDPRTVARQVYRRIVFNCLIGNTDDHDRNTGFLAQPDGSFDLSPVFDLTCRPDTGRMVLAMGFGAEGATVSIENLLSECELFGFTKDEARGIIDGQWKTLRNGFVDLLVAVGCKESIAQAAFLQLPGHRLLSIA